MQHVVRGPGQDLARHLACQLSGEHAQVQRALRAPPHGVHIRQRVGRGARAPDDGEQRLDAQPDAIGVDGGWVRGIAMLAACGRVATLLQRAPPLSPTSRLVWQARPRPSRGRRPVCRGIQSFARPHYPIKVQNKFD